jgi:hypothetical protein
MEKFGWKEGQGLGKNEDGISDHIKAKKREENTGVRTPSKTQPVCCAVLCCAVLCCIVLT